MTNSAAANAETSLTPGASAWPWLLVALLAQTGWGMYPALARYLQIVGGLPGLSLLTVGYAPMFVAFLIWVGPRYGAQIVRSRPLWIFAFVVGARSATNVLAARYTAAIYVSLINLLTPFLVALLSTLALRERLPRYTLPAMVLSFAGSLLMLSSGLGAAGLRFDLTADDRTGVALALTSALFLAFYMLAVRGTLKANLPSGATLVFQSAVIFATALPLSLLAGEDWSAWAALGRQGWAAMLVFMVVALVLANSLQITALRHAGAAAVSSLMGWRLVATLFTGMFLLDEHLASAAQVVGMITVLATVSWYLFLSSRGADARV